MADCLKVRYHSDRTEAGWLGWNPSNFELTLNDHKIEMVTSLVLKIEGIDDVPHATIGFYLDELDIDVDSLIALEAIVKQKGSLEESNATSS